MKTIADYMKEYSMLGVTDLILYDHILSETQDKINEVMKVLEDQFSIEEIMKYINESYTLHKTEEYIKNASIDELTEKLKSYGIEFEENL